MTTQTQSSLNQGSQLSVSVREMGDGRILWRAFCYLRPYWRYVAGAYLALMATTALVLITPQFIRWIVDHGIREQNISLLTWSVLALLGVTLGKGVFTFFEGRWTETASQSVAYDVRNAIHRKLADLSFAYHDQTEAGQLLSRTLQDVERIRFLTS